MEGVCFGFIVIAELAFDLEKHQAFAVQQQMSRFVKEGKPELVVGLVAETQHQQCGFRGQPAHRAAHRTTVRRRFQHGCHTGRCAQMRHFRYKDRRIGFVGQVTQLAQDLPESPAIEWRRVDGCRATLTLAQPGCHGPRLLFVALGSAKGRQRRNVTFAPRCHGSYAEKAEAFANLRGDVVSKDLAANQNESYR